MDTQHAAFTAEQKQGMLAAIVDTSDDVIVSKTLEGVITSWNRAAEEMFGYTGAEALGQNITLIIPDTRLQEEKMILERISAGLKIDHFETERRHKSGNLIPISLSVSPIIDIEGKVIGASKIARNISDRLQAESKQAVLAAIVDSSDDAIISKNLQGEIMSWNRAAERLFGYTEAEALGRHISLIIPQSRLQEEEYIIGKIRSGQRVDHFETYRVAKNGLEIPLSLTVSPVVDPRGVVIGASKIARDITFEREAREEAQRLYREIRMLNDKKDEFVAVASHELKTPITTISGYLQILERSTEQEAGKAFVRKAIAQLKKLSELVSDLLDVSMIEAGKMQLRTARFDLHRLVGEVIELMNHSARHSISFRYDTDVCEIEGDRNRLEQVLVNLLGNAIKYSPGHNHVEVFLSTGGGQATIAVRDHGVGISAEKLAHIFSRFYRAEEVSQNISGLGLGLFVASQIVEQHGGTIGVESAPGQGSTFTVSLPLPHQP